MVFKKFVNNQVVIYTMSHVRFKREKRKVEWTTLILNQALSNRANTALTALESQSQSLCTKQNTGILASHSVLHSKACKTMLTINDAVLIYQYIDESITSTIVQCTWYSTCKWTGALGGLPYNVHTVMTSWL